MPIYAFSCRNEKCKADFTELYKTFVGIDEAVKTTKCPHCGTTDKKQLMTVPIMMAPSHLTERNHDYRFKDNIQNVKAEREYAEAASKVGNNPYNGIDDISGGDNFGLPE